MGIQSPRRKGAVKKCKKRGTRFLTKRPLGRTQYAIDTGGVAFIPTENCLICKAQDLNSRGITTRTPRRAHHELRFKNLKTRAAYVRTIIANQEAARNLAANSAAIANKTSTYQGFFAVGANHRVTKSAEESVDFALRLLLGETDGDDDNDNSNHMLNLPDVPAAPPLFMQPTPSTAACFLPPIPSVELVVPFFYATSTIESSLICSSRPTCRTGGCGLDTAAA
jgi:hypothetical protein